MLKYSVAVLSFAAALASAPSASAQGSFDMFGGQFLIDSEVDSERRLDVFGLRAGWGIAPRWGVEGSLSWSEEGPLDLYFGDLSLRWTPNPDRRVRFYALGGPGVFHVELDDGVLGDPDDELALHLGTGAEVDLGRGFVLRPDVRLRWIDDGGDDVHTEATLGVGFRF